MTKYVIITPVRNEAAYLEQHIESVVAQTVKPIEWVIVDDGSTDGTGAIVDRWAGRHSWIKAVHRNDRGFRHTGGGIEAFYEGYRTLTTKDWEYLVNLDGDLALEPKYFEMCFEEFAKDPQLGIGGGTVYHLENGVPRVEHNPLFHVRGATKIYRKACWDALGMLVAGPGWDTVDELKAHQLGWKTRSFPNIRVLHCRPTGTEYGLWGNAVKNGRANYVTGYHPVFMIMKCLRRAVRKPYLVEAAGLMYGFLSGYVLRVPRINDRGLIRFVRKQQVRKLLFLESMWN